MLKEYMLEYIDIVDLIIKNNSYYKLKSENIAIEKDYLKDIMLKRFIYYDFSKKLKLWKQLNLIVTEGRRFTSKITINSKRKPVIVFNIKTYKILKDVQIKKEIF
jgi:hypothetical protein